MKNLATLMVSVQGIISFPRNIICPESLLTLNIQLSQSLPEGLERASLQSLSFSHNFMRTDITEWIGQLENLEELVITTAFLSALPESMSKLRNLSRLFQIS